MNEKIAKALRQQQRNKELFLPDYIQSRLSRYYKKLLATSPVKSPKPRKKKASQRKDPSWPRTENQRRQSRPVIYEAPLRHIASKLGLGTGIVREGFFEGLRDVPKFGLDNIAAMVDAGKITKEDLLMKK